MAQGALYPAYEGPVDEIVRMDAKVMRADVVDFRARRTRTMKRWNGTRADPLLLERARSECARSTAAVRPDTGAVPEEGKGTSPEG